MAILQKRKSSKQLPRFERYQDTRGGDRAAALRGETPVTSRVTNNAATSVAPKVSTSTGNTAASTSSKLPSLTSATSATKPASTLTSTGTGAGTSPAKSLTSTGSGAAKTTAPTTTANKSSSGSSLGKTLTSALAGAALGVGTKAVVDKFTGAKKTAGTAGSAGTGLTSAVNKNLSTMGGGTGLKTTTNAGGTGIKTTGTSGTGVKTTGTTGTAGSNAVTSTVKTPVVKTTGTTTGSKVPVTVTTGGPKTPVTSGPKTPVTSGPKTPTGAGPKTPAGTGGTRGIAGTAGAAVGAATTGDGTDTTVGGVAYDDDGNLMPGYELDEEGNPVYVGMGGTDTAVVTDTVDNGDGTTTVTYDDGSTVTTDITGDVVDSTDAIDTGDDTTLADGYFTDDEGNVYDGEGNLVQYADGSVYEEGGDTEVAYTDDYGNTYDANGDLIAEGDHSDYVYTAEDGSTYDYDGNLIAEADHTGFTQEDEYGNTYDYDGNLVSYADGYNPDDYTNEDDTEYASVDDEEIDFGAKGGLFGMAKGGVPRFADGDAVYSDTEEEVQPFQNVDYNYGEFDEPTMTGDNSLYSQSGPIRNTYARASTASVGDPVAENDNGDGTITQFFDDGSSITYDNGGNVLDVTEATDGSSTGGTSQGGTDNRQYFDDGSYIETFDDGSTVTYDAEGNAFSSTDVDGNTELAKTTTYDDEGNQIVSDYYGNIVKVLDPEGNVIPLGGGRVNAGPITGAGGKTSYDLTPNKTPAQIAADKRAAAADEAAQQSAIDKLLAGINTNTGAGVTGAVLGALLGNSDLFSSGSGNNTAGFDMSKVGNINPRTTDFGIGPANYVGYDQYGTPEAMPELYGNELYQNLNAPGFNEVNEGDYARMDAEESGEEPPVEGMSEGGLPQGGLGASQTFYTFGKPTDPMQNLYNPQPAQQQPQAPQGMNPQVNPNQQQMPMGQMPMGQPPQGMPQNMGNPPMQPQNPMQTGPQGLKSGGLPAWSNVPITAGRLNFRNGAPVHGAGDGQSDDIPAMLADGEYVIDAETVAQIGNGSTKAGAQALDKFRENIRAHKRSAPINKIPPKTKALTSYLRGAK